MTYYIKEYIDYNEQEILPLYESVGWINYTKNPVMLREAYKHSLKIYAAYLNEQLVGLIRVVGDGFSVVFVQDILVYPEYQRQGIGTALLKKVLEEFSGVYQLHLLTDNTEKTVAFYKSFGFVMDTDMNCRAFSKYCVD
ncbi:MAG: GNAT family N-acetyltransferase [Lachnospiraceae bacterium]|nr:GNAT family N-acetyltransferase [Lachnospiraceae bacterium]